MEAAKRIYSEKGRMSEQYASQEDAYHHLKKRYELEQAHFMKNYHLDITDLNQFDLVIDTTLLTPQQVFEKILTAL